MCPGRDGCCGASAGSTSGCLVRSAGWTSARLVRASTATSDFRGMRLVRSNREHQRWRRITVVELPAFAWVSRCARSLVEPQSPVARQERGHFYFEHDSQTSEHLDAGVGRLVGVPGTALNLLKMSPRDACCRGKLLLCPSRVDARGVNVCTQLTGIRRPGLNAHEGQRFQERSVRRLTISCKLFTSWILGGRQTG